LGATVAICTLSSAEPLFQTAPTLASRQMWNGESPAIGSGSASCKHSRPTRVDMHHQRSVAFAPTRPQTCLRCPSSSSGHHNLPAEVSLSSTLRAVRLALQWSEYDETGTQTGSQVPDLTARTVPRHQHIRHQPKFSLSQALLYLGKHTSTPDCEVKPMRLAATSVLERNCT
jgi:hypothetical protein